MKWLGRVLLGVLALCIVCTALVVVWGYSDRVQDADAIVVLGAAQYAGRPSPVLRQRLHHAIGLWKEQRAPLLILTGGVGDGEKISEAEVAGRFAIQQGVDSAAVILETRGRTTRESMSAVSSLMKERSLRRAILVSDRFHMFRVHILARQYGIVGHPSPVPSSPFSLSVATGAQFLLTETAKAIATLLQWPVAR